MSDFTLATTITGDTTSLIRSMATAKEQVRLFGSEVEKSVASSGKSMGSKVPSDFEKARQAASKFGTETRKSLREAAQATDDLANKGGRSMSSFAAMFGKFSGATTIAALAVQIGKTGIGFQDFTSKNEMAFETMLGSAEAAKTYMADILAFAKETPFAFPELTSSAQQMVAFGVDSSKVIGILRTLGDAAVGAGGGITEMQGLATVIGQIQAKGRLQNEEILQLAERGLPALRVLANQANMTTAEYQKAVTAGSVDADTAITSLVDGLRDGTSGVNGMTAAYGGLMEKMKASGNFSSTWDSVKSSFRNMSASITESLLPILLDLMDGLQDVMKFVMMISDAFNLLPQPLKTATIAFLAFSIASKAFGQKMSVDAVTGVGKFITSMRALYLEQVKAQGGIVFNGRGAHSANNFGTAVATAGQRAKAGFSVISAGAKSAGSALLGVFGGPIGLAVTAGLTLLTAGFASSSSANAEAKSRLEEYKATLDATTGSITKATEKLGEQRLNEDTSLLWMRGTLSKDADKIGLDLNTLADALAGNVDAIRKVESITDETMSGFWDSYFQDDFRAAARLQEEMKRVKQMLEAKEEEQRVADELRKNEQARPKSVLELADAYREAQYALNGFNEETEKTIEKYAQGFGDAFDSAFSTVSGFKAVKVTTEEYASAQEKVADANKKVAEAQKAQNRLGELRTTSKQRTDAANSVTEALKAQGSAYKDLNDLKAKDRPVADQMKDYFSQTLKDAESFSKDIQTLIEKGLDPNLIEDLVKKGPEEASSEMKAYLSANGDALIQMANQTEETLRGLNSRVVENARLSAIAMNSDLSSIAADLPLAMKMAAKKGDASTMTTDELAEMLGVTSDDVARVAATFGQDWVTTVEEDLASKTVQLKPPWALNQEDSAVAFLEGNADNAVIQPRIMIDPVYGIVTTPEEYLRAMEASGTPVGGSRSSQGGSFANGGVLPGYSPGRDNFTFYSPTGGVLNIGGGEAIMRPEFGAAVGHNWIHAMNRLARDGGVGAIRNAMFKQFGTQSFANGGIFNGTPSVVEVPVTSRVEHHGTVNVEKVVANDPLEFEREMRAARKNRNAFG